MFHEIEEENWGQMLAEDGIVKGEEGGVVLTKDINSGIDVCPHEWELLREKHGIQVFRCKVNGCLWFRTKHRTAIGKFIYFFKRLPKIPVKLPPSGYHSDEELGRIFGMDPRTVKDYAEALEDLVIDGAPAYFEADSRVYYYRDDPNTADSWWNRWKGWIGFSTGALLTGVIAWRVYGRKCQPDVANPRTQGT